MNQEYRIICERLKQFRINYPLTQSELAEKSGVSVRSISRFENGEDISMSKFICILRALDLSERLIEIIPDQSKRPSYYLEQENKRIRASGNRGNSSKSPFVWGEDK
ncbi:MAG: helix-turn-helix domain-containing protein, partial [Saccharofermentans sp.]|nr:helix-turn-helix domain-containing protein [Saccharofermentans sp.]